MQLQPTIAAEVGWSESYPRLKRDIRLWLKESAATNVAFLVSFNKRSHDRVSRFLEVYRKVAFGEPVLSSRHVSLEPCYLAFAILTVLFFKEIFPAPQGPDTFAVTMAELWGPAVPPGRNPVDTWAFSVDKLRQSASIAAVQMGLTPV